MTSPSFWSARSRSRARLGSRTLAVATAAMAVLLVVLAVLQYHWVGEVSEAARERMRRELETAADRIADDFDREVFRAFVAFQPPRDTTASPSAGDSGLTERAAGELAAELADGWERWRASAFEPALVAAVYVVDADRRGPHSDGGDGGPRSDRGPHADSVLWRLDPEARELRPADWPPELMELDRRFDLAGSGRRATLQRQRGPRVPMVAPAPALLLPIRRSRPGGPDDEEARARESVAFVVVLLDRQRIGRALLPALVELHLGPEPREIGVWVLDRSRRGERVFATGPVAPDPGRRADLGVVARPLLTLRFFPELRAQGFRRFFDDPEARRTLDAERRFPGPFSGPQGRPSPNRGGPGGGAEQERRGPPDDERLPGAPGFARSLQSGAPEPGPWALVLARSEGSLDAAVSRLRRRNLGVGLAVVALLGGTAALLLVAASQAQRLARREMELVAGITHELRTPLAAIGSAADNLADGVVVDPAQVRRYGSLIRGETHRLGSLVAQVLDFAGGAAARRRARPLEAVDVASVVDRVLVDLHFLIEEKSFVVERSAAPGLPRALADADALRRALDNVVGNALKYGEHGRWIGIELAPGGTGIGGLALQDSGRIAIRVRDRGPGIARGERRRVFEPFYRGESSAAPHLHGTGLGLAVTRSVLESFGGTIEIEESEAGRGATFLITLPAAPFERMPPERTTPEPTMGEPTTGEPTPPAAAPPRPGASGGADRAPSRPQP